MRGDYLDLLARTHRAAGGKHVAGENANPCAWRNRRLYLRSSERTVAAETPGSRGSRQIPPRVAQEGVLVGLVPVNAGLKTATRSRSERHPLFEKALPAARL